ncbi:MAG: hypothetical protein PF448_07770 [Bacteroidales bacterium]|jgi:hypothetical protein|nr:hypothetical protein [Bacteroidales bacterium]
MIGKKRLTQSTINNQQSAINNQQLTINNQQSTIRAKRVKQLAINNTSEASKAISN